MQHVRLGRTGLQVSRICLGTMTFGLQVDEERSRAILDHAADKGVTFLDTADVYPLGGDLTTAGRTEEIVGRWLHGKRDDYVVATKCFGPMGPRPWDMGNSRRHIMDAIDASLRRLQTDFVDLYQLHFDDRRRAARRDARRARRPRARRQGALRRLLELPRVPPRARARAQRDAGHRAVRVRAAALQPALPRVRTRAVPALPRRRHRRHPVQPDRGRHALGQARPDEAARGGHALHARERRRGRTRTATGTTTCSTPSTSSSSSPTKRGCRCRRSRSRGCCATRRSPSPIVGASRPEQLDATIAAVDTPLDDDLAERLDEVTAEYRRGDAPRSTRSRSA